MELIKISTSQKGNSVVSGRELHAFLEVKSRFNDWIKSQCERAMLDANIDYVAITEKKVTAQGNESEYTDVVLRLSSAKEIAMLNGGDKGKQARLYFIECERKLQELAPPPMTQIEATILLLQKMAEQEKINIQLANRIEEVASQNIIKDEKFYTISGYANILKIKVDRTAALLLGRQASTISKSSGYPIGKAFDEKYGKINTYHIDILKLTFKN